jgi:hypothetical protein
LERAEEHARELDDVVRRGGFVLPEPIDGRIDLGGRVLYVTKGKGGLSYVERNPAGSKEHMNLNRIEAIEAIASWLLLTSHDPERQHHGASPTSLRVRQPGLAQETST